MKSKMLFLALICSSALNASNILAAEVAPVVATLASIPASSNASAPDALVKNLVDSMIQSIKDQKLNQGQQSNYKKISELIEAKIMPHADLEATTKLAMGQNWEKATTEQRAAIMKEFKYLLIATYTAPFARFNDQQISYKPLRALPSDTKVIVKTTIVDQGETKSLDYRLHKVNQQWKIYDLTILGVGLVSSYKADFAAQINKNGIDGLIKFLQAKNKK